MYFCAVPRIPTPLMTVTVWVVYLLLAEEVCDLIHHPCDGILDPVAYLARVKVADGGLVLDPLVHR